MIEEFGFYNYPKHKLELEEITLQGACTGFGGCPVCNNKDGKCLPNCIRDQYVAGTTCTDCDNDFCQACWGANKNQCYWCHDVKRYTYDVGPADSCRAECGDGRVDPGEACDDGNLMNHDGCDDACTVEAPNWVCAHPNMISICRQTTNCETNQNRYLGNNQCQDNNNANGDGCDN